jgi:hypothetical protein
LLLSSNICDSVLIKNLEANLLAVEELTAFNYRCSFPLQYLFLKDTHEGLNIPQIYFTETVFKKFSIIAGDFD